MPFISDRQYKSIPFRYLMLAGVISVLLLTVCGILVIETVFEQAIHQLMINHAIFTWLGLCLALPLSVWAGILSFRKMNTVRQQKQSFNTLLENSPLAIYLLDTNAKLIFFNKSACEIVGYTPTELASKHLTELDIILRDKLAQEKVLWQNMRVGQKVTRESAMINKFGFQIETEVTITKLLVAGETQILAFVKDVTAKRIADSAIRDKHNRLHLALKGAKAAMWDINLEKNQFTVDEHWAGLIGYESSELDLNNFETFNRFIHPEDMATSKKEMENYLSGKTDAFQMIVRIRHRKGHWLSFWSSAKVTKRNANGEPVLITGTNVEITELVESQSALKKSEAMFQAVVNSIDDLIFIIDNDLICQQTYGKPIREGIIDRSQIIGRTPQDALGPITGQLIYDHMQKAMEEGSGRLNWSPDLVTHYQTRFSKIIGANQEVLGLASVSREITQERNAELQLHKEKDRLAFLTKTARDLNELNSYEETYDYLVKSLNEIMGGTGLVMAVDYTQSDTHFTVVSVAGSDIIKSLLQSKGFTGFKGLSSPKNLSLVPILETGKLQDITELMFQEEKITIPESLQSPLKELLQDFQMKVIGITHNDTVMGNITLLCNKNIHQLERDLVETLVQQASAVLEKNIVLNRLTESQTKLRLSEKKYKMLVDTAPVIIYEYDVIDGAKFYSKQVSNILGYTDGYLLTNSLWEDSIHPEDIERVREAEQGFISGSGFDIEYRIRHQNGEWRWFRDLSMNHTESNRLIRGMVIDITEEKRLAQTILEQFEQIKEQEIVLRMAIANGKQGVFDWNLLSDHLTWNTEFMNILEGNSNIDLNFYEYFYGFVHLADRMALAPKLEKLFSGEQEFLDEIFRIRTPLGIKWVRINGRLVEKTAQGHGQRFVGTMTDVSVMKEAEKAQEEYSKHLRLIIESIPGIVFSCHPDEAYNMIFISDYVETITEYEADAFYNGIHFGELIHPDDQEAFYQEIAMAFQEKRRFAFSFRIKTKSGKERWLNEVGEFRAYDLPMQENRIDGVIFDITDNIRAEERMLNATIDATDRERMRIALEIHNNIQQTLVNAYLNFESMKGDLQGLSPRQREKFLSGLKSLNTGLEDTRLIARTLMPKQVQDFGYIDSVENLIANLDPNIQFDFYYNVNERFEEKTELNLFKITQEALGNIVKHASATQVFIQLIKHDKSLTLTIDDDGVGFDSKNAAVQKNGYGIHAMKSRAANIGARFELSSHPGRGTYLIVEVPLIPVSNPVNYV